MGRVSDRPRAWASDRLPRSMVRAKVPSPEPHVSPTPLAGGVARLPFTGPWLLAPMEGVTAPSFRDLVLARNPAAHLGGAYTEFIRVVDHGVPKKVFHEHLGPRRFPAPVGVQLMGRDLAALAASAVHAVEVGVPLVDLNFGCPAKGALRGCAGAGALKDPCGMEAVVAAVVRAVAGAVPVTGKIRAGYDDANDVETLARAVEAGGAAMLTVHCRTRAEGYQPEVDWTRIARAVGAVSIPVCGNGGIDTHADLHRMRRETGAAFAMVGRGAIADPWVFSGHAATTAEAAGFLLEYYEYLVACAGEPRSPVQRVKQLLRYWTAGGVVRDEEDRLTWLREPDPLAVIARLRALLV